MATSADRDEKDADEKDEATDEAPPRKKGEKAEPAKGRAAKASAPVEPADDADEEDEEDEEEEEEATAAPKASSKSAAAEEDEDEEDEPAPRRPAGKGPGAKGPGAKGPGARGPGARGPRGPGAVVARPVPPSGGGSLGKSVALFFVIVIGLGLGFAILGREPSQEQAKPKWTQGQVVDVEITLVRSDRQDLACAAADEIGGKHCAFEAVNKPWSKGGDPNDDKLILKPYTTLDRMQFTAAGLWAEPALGPDKLPATRFSVKCKYKVEGTIKNVGVRWEQTGQWFPNNEWYAGTISGCTLAP